MTMELTRLMTFATKEEMARSIEHSESSISVNAFLAKFVSFVKRNRLDDIERIVADGRLEDCFQHIEMAEEPLKKWGEIHPFESDQLADERYDRYLSGS